MPTILNKQTCGTCEYWNGARAAGKGGVQCNSASEKGYCQHKTMSKTIAHPASQPGCPKYTRWQQLR